MNIHREVAGLVGEIDFDPKPGRGMASPPAEASADRDARLSMFGEVQDLVRDRKWPEALALLEALATRWPKSVDQNVDLERARVLRELGRFPESEAVVRGLLQRRPRSRAALRGLLRILNRSGRHDEALTILDASPLSGARHADLLAARFAALIGSRRLAAARIAFAEAMTWAEDAENLTCLFEVSPRLLWGHDLTKARLSLLCRAERPADDPGQAFAGLELRLLIALRDYRRFSDRLESIEDIGAMGLHGPLLRSVAEALARPCFPDYSRPKVFGVGLSKTGTTSLAKALRILGLTTADWLNPLTGELVCDDDLALFDAFTDTPSCLNFERNFHMFPNSKFILTTRPMDPWVKSWAGHMKRLWNVSGLAELRQSLSRPDLSIFGRPFGDIQMTLYGNSESLEDAYRGYHRRVRTFFEDKPADRFLELDLYSGAGWPELCSFLGLATPDRPFPWEKRAPTPSATAGS